MAYTKYSLTPANNNAAPPDGAPEGMLPSAVNDTMRDMMAQIRDVGDGIRGGTYTMTAPVITGGSINGTTVGAGTASTGAFTTLGASGVATFSAGSASAPAITTTGDTNTGIFFPAADTIAFTEGGVEAMRIDSTGNVGIGAAPNNSFPARLNLSNAEDCTLRITKSGVSASAIKSISNALTFGVDGSAGDTERMRIDSSGRVVIGALSTAAKFQVSGASANTYMLIDNAAGGENYFAANSANIFQTAGTERIRIDSSGLVGIGSSSPNAQLVIQGAGGAGQVAGSRNTLYLRHSSSSGNQSNYIGFGSAGSATSCFILNDIQADGNTVNQLNIQAGASGGVFLANGGTSWSSASDERLKNITGNYEQALLDIAKIKPVKFTWKFDVDNKPQVGVIAQSVEYVVPEAVDKSQVSAKDKTEYLSIRYTELIPLMIASIQELNAKVIALEAQLGAK